MEPRARLSLSLSSRGERPSSDPSCLTTRRWARRGGGSVAVFLEASFCWWVVDSVGGSACCFCFFSLAATLAQDRGWSAGGQRRGMDGAGRGASGIAVEVDSTAEWNSDAAGLGKVGGIAASLREVTSAASDTIWDRVLMVD